MNYVSKNKQLKIEYLNIQISLEKGETNTKLLERKKEILKELNGK